MRHQRAREYLRHTLGAELLAGTSHGKGEDLAALLEELQQLQLHRAVAARHGDREAQHEPQRRRQEREAAAEASKKNAKDAAANTFAVVVQQQPPAAAAGAQQSG